MDDMLKLQNLYGVLLTDIDRLPERTQLYEGTLSSLLTKNMSPIYKGRACVFLETDWDHVYDFFLSNIEGLNFRLDNKKGPVVEANINRVGRCPKYGSKTFYELAEDKISRKHLEELLKSRKRVLGSETYHDKPIVQIIPVSSEALDDRLFLIKNGEKFFEHTF